MNNLQGYTKRHLASNIPFWLSCLSFTQWIIILNVILFFAVQIALFFISPDKLYSFLAINPANLLERGYIWTLITSLFLHAGIFHLFANMVSLHFLGNFAEMIVGRKRFFWFYFIAGIFAGLIFSIMAYIFGDYGVGARLFGTISEFAVGASGAIFGIAGLLAMIMPNMRVYVFFFIPMKMWQAIVVLIFGLWIISFGTGLPIGNSAHFGGLLAGIIYGLSLKLKYKNKVKLIGLYYSK